MDAQYLKRVGGRLKEIMKCPVHACRYDCNFNSFGNLFKFHYLCYDVKLCYKKLLLCKIIPDAMSVKLRTLGGGGFVCSTNGP